MSILPKGRKLINVPKLKIDDCLLKVVDTYKYLGMINVDSTFDDKDMERQMRSFYVI